jgi:hypothetical protein
MIKKITIKMGSTTKSIYQLIIRMNTIIKANSMSIKIIMARIMLILTMLKKKIILMRKSLHNKMD